MDIEHYIASGTLEAYVMGHASEQERKEVECLSSIYPEIKAALVTIEADMERFAQAYAINAPAGLRSRIMTEVGKTKPDPVIRKVREDESGPASAKTQNTTATATVIDLQKSSARTPWYWAAAAAILALLGVWQYVEIQSKSSALETTLAELREAQKALTQEQSALASVQESLQEVFDPAVRKIVMAGVNEKAPENVALFWNTSTGLVTLDASALPSLPADKQYQLWVLKDGLPCDMGVLPKDAAALIAASESTLVGDAFAITIEPLGGLPAPTLEQLVVIGNVV